MSITTASDVKAILDTALSDQDIGAFINGATELVNNTLSALPEALRNEIVRWLSAHLIASTREQQIAEAGAGPASVKFQGTTGLGLDSTQYGQQVKVLDYTGTLAGLSNPAKYTASLFAIGSFE